MSAIWGTKRIFAIDLAGAVSWMAFAGAMLTINSDPGFSVTVDFVIVAALALVAAGLIAAMSMQQRWMLDNEPEGAGYGMRWRLRHRTFPLTFATNFVALAVFASVTLTTWF